MSNTSSSGGIGFVGALTVLFVALKLLGIINWSWWLVWSPVLIATAIWIILCIIITILTLEK